MQGAVSILIFLVFALSAQIKDVRIRLPSACNISRPIISYVDTKDIDPDIFVQTEMSYVLNGIALRRVYLYLDHGFTWMNALGASNNYCRTGMPNNSYSVFYDGNSSYGLLSCIYSYFSVAIPISVTFADTTIEGVINTVLFVIDILGRPRIVSSVTISHSNPIITDFTITYVTLQDIYGNFVLVSSLYLEINDNFLRPLLPSKSHSIRDTTESPIPTYKRLMPNTTTFEHSIILFVQPSQISIPFALLYDRICIHKGIFIGSRVGMIMYIILIIVVFIPFYIIVAILANDFVIGPSSLSTFFSRRFFFGRGVSKQIGTGVSSLPELSWRHHRSGLLTNREIILTYLSLAHPGYDTDTSRHGVYNTVYTNTTSVINKLENPQKSLIISGRTLDSHLLCKNFSTMLGPTNSSSHRIDDQPRLQPNKTFGRRPPRTSPLRMKRLLRWKLDPSKKGRLLRNTFINRALAQPDIAAPSIHGSSSGGASLIASRSHTLLRKTSTFICMRGAATLCSGIDSDFRQDLPEFSTIQHHSHTSDERKHVEGAVKPYLAAGLDEPAPTVDTDEKKHWSFMGDAMCHTKSSEISFSGSQTIMDQQSKSRTGTTDRSNALHLRARKFDMSVLRMAQNAFRVADASMSSASAQLVDLSLDDSKAPIDVSERSTIFGDHTASFRICGSENVPKPLVEPSSGGLLTHNLRVVNAAQSSEMTTYLSNNRGSVSSYGYSSTTEPPQIKLTPLALCPNAIGRHQGGHSADYSQVKDSGLLPVANERLLSKVPQAGDTLFKSATVDVSMSYSVERSENSPHSNSLDALANLRAQALNARTNVRICSRRNSVSQSFIEDYDGSTKA